MLKSASIAALVVLLAVPRVVYAQANSLFIEDLTWEEVAAALKAGKTTALIYTGGGEQNGPHLAFGKHNAVARYLAERIAKELGNALIYPVLPYSPSGDPSKKEGQMAFPGSSSLTDETYGMVLRDLALGAATAGFRDIILIGDHGGGQDVLKQTAATLDARLRPSGARVFYCDDLYFKSRDEFSLYLTRTQGDRGGPCGRGGYVGDSVCEARMGAQGQDRGEGSRQGRRGRPAIRQSGTGQGATGPEGQGCGGTNPGSGRQPPRASNTAPAAARGRAPARSTRCRACARLPRLLRQRRSLQDYCPR